MSIKVIGPLAIVRVAGADVYLPRGSDVPSAAEADSVAHLKAVGLISEVADEVVVDDSDPYRGFRKADYVSAIEARNADRDDEHKIVPASDKNDDLLAALVADDAAQAESTDDGEQA